MKTNVVELNRVNLNIIGLNGYVHKWNADSDGYIKFKDPVVAQICATNWGDGIGLTKEQAATVTSLGSVFSSNTEITSFDELELFTGIKTINQSAFASSSIKSVRLSNNVTTIGDSAFYQSSLESINIPPSVTSLGWGAFIECKSLVMEELYLPNLTGNLDGGQFGYGAQIRKVTSLGNIAVMSETFGGNKLLEMCILPDTLTKLSGGVFSGCSNLRTLVLKQENIILLSSNVFKNCTNLKIEIDLPNLSTLDKYGESCFENSGITKVLNLGATSNYQNNMFKDCKNLTYVNLPSTTTTVGYNLFNGCSNLETLIVNATTPPTLGYATFFGCDKMTIYVPDNSVDAYKAATGWVEYASRIKPLSELPE